MIKLTTPTIEALKGKRIRVCDENNIYEFVNIIWHENRYYYLLKDKDEEHYIIETTRNVEIWSL